MADRLKLCIEGWRGINHSYSMVNQWQLLELAKHDIDLYHRDIPYFAPSWNRRDNSSGLSEELSRALDLIPAPMEGDYFDAVYRITYPYNVGPSNSDRLYVFGTSEFQSIDGMFLNNDHNSGVRNEACYMVTPSRWSKIGFLKAGFPDDRVLVVPHGIDPGSYDSDGGERRAISRQKLALTEDDFVLCSLGAMTTNKGIDILLRAFWILRQKYQNLKLILKDQSNLYGIRAPDIVLDVCKRLGITDRRFFESLIIISQNLTVEKLRSLYLCSDVYVSPYRAEGFNIPPLEAAACGVPIIVTKHGSTDDYFADVLGFRIESSIVSVKGQTMLQPSLESLVANLETLILHRGRFKSRLARDYVHSRYNWSVVTTELTRAIGLR